MDFSKKLKFIRKKERLTQLEFSELVDLPLRAIKSWESEGQIMGADKLLKITNHPRFKKYTQILINDDYADAYMDGFKENESLDFLDESLLELEEREKEQSKIEELAGQNIEANDLLEHKLKCLNPDLFDEVMNYMDYLFYRQSNKDDQS